MFLKEKATGDLVSVVELTNLVNPSIEVITGQYQHGQEEQDPESFKKEALMFPSGEALPSCWLDAHYRDHELKH